MKTILLNLRWLCVGAVGVCHIAFVVKTCPELGAVAFDTKIVVVALFNAVAMTDVDVKVVVLLPSVKTRVFLSRITGYRRIYISLNINEKLLIVPESTDPDLFCILG